MGDDVATMIEWFHERNQRYIAAGMLAWKQRIAESKVIEADMQAWWELTEELSPADYARLAQWYDEMHAA